MPQARCGPSAAWIIPMGMAFTGDVTRDLLGFSKIHHPN
jgi:hypothetical protein